MSVEDTETLAPCPHCGHEVELMGHGRVITFVCPPESSCIGSGLGVFAMTDKRKEAIEAWNRRVNYNE
jgi:hypothetical protein